MSRPVIGITTSCGPDPKDTRPNERFYVNRLYADRLAEAGADPILLTTLTPPEVAREIVDGVLIPGGDDIDAAHFGQENHASIKLEDPGRFPYEKSLLDVLGSETPVFGICYGCQAMNVYRGGDLLQHIPDRVPGSQHTGGVMQTYAIEPDSRLAEVLGATEAEGESFHHQANDRAGDGLRVVGRTPDGVVEAVEDTGDRWFLGVQWHPERTPENPSTVRLFKSFVEQAAEHRRSRGR
ncbi:MAG: gamma-glutamyl-gamma-aminobutyrate hydrolase family protein [Armatimonadetes bacterium]|nr:gamma-glutamyl-gamma-aminobutyrate hydrolase family protein [Armatimonadota bacterium]